MNKSREFLKAIDEVWQSEFPQQVINRARDSLLDYLAVTCAGAKYQEEKLNNIFQSNLTHLGNYKAIGTHRMFSLMDSVFFNGLNSHTLDMDDGTNEGIIHLGSPIFSLLIPLACGHRLTIESLLQAAIIGYEVSFSLATSIQPKHKMLGFHATGTCGTIGSTIAACYMLNFTEDELFNSFSSACAAASGTLKVLDEGSDLKPYNVAKASLLALTAIEMGVAGFCGGEDPLAGRGFLKMMTGEEDVEIRPLFADNTFAIMKSYTKPYASCRYTHPAVEAALFLRDAVNIHKIESIQVITYDLAIKGHDHSEVSGDHSAKMSIPYAVSAALLFGKVGVDEFSTNNIDNSELKGLMKKTRVDSDSEFSKAFPRYQTAIVIIRTKDGKECQKKVIYPKGEPENPLSDEEFKDRYNELMGYAGIEKEVRKSIYNTVKEGGVVSDIMLGL